MSLAEVLDVRPGEAASMVLRRVTALDPVAAIDGVHDVVVRDGRIAELAAPGEGEADGAEVIEAEGLHAFPAFFDPHVHLRTPGHEHKEDVETGTRAAAAGGYCGILAMANTEPPVSTAADITALREQARAAASVPVGFLATVTRDMKGEDLTEMVELREVGAVGFSDDGLPIVSARVMLRALQYQRLCGGTIALHEEDPELSGAGVMHEGPVSAGLGLAGVPSVSESTMIARDAALAAYEEARIHVQHLSAAESVEVVRAAKAAGVKISAEASPHHLCLTDEEVRSLDPRRFKMNPPLRREADRQALIEALRDGTIECIATDHAPHQAEEKEVPFEQAAMGVTGLETAFAALHTELVMPGTIGSACWSSGWPAAPRLSDSRGRAWRRARRRTSPSATSAPSGPWGRTATRAARRTPGAPAGPSPGGSWSRSRPARSPSACAASASGSLHECLPAPRGRDPLRRRPCGDPRAVAGEVVFNTAMTGYQEAVTDPSYAGQIIVFTYPLIGNYGVSAAAMESDRVHARGVVMRDAKNGEDAASAEGGWLDWLGDCGVPGITGVDTRALVRHIRDRGAMRGGVFPGETSEAEARDSIVAEPSMDGADFARTVTPPEPVRFDGDGPHVVGIDTGIKMSIVRQLREHGAKLTLLPCDSSPEQVLAEDPDIVFLANGPGDPAALGYVVETVREIVGKRPLFGICLGHQLLCRAVGLETYKLPFGHRGANHPVKDLETGRIDITSQNHGFAVAGPGGEPRIEGDEPVRWDTDFGVAELSQLNLYDRTVEGLVLRDVAGATVQYHPEAGPGPHDARHLFDRFLALAA